MITSTHTTYLYEYLATEAKNRIFVSINKIVWCSIFEWYIEEIKLTYVNIFLPVVFISNYYTRGHNMIIYIFFFSFCLGAIHKWRQIYRGRGVSENLMLINKISKFYTIKVWQGGVQNPRKRPDVMMAPYIWSHNKNFAPQSLLTKSLRLFNQAATLPIYLNSSYLLAYYVHALLNFFTFFA